ncbi:MAG: hypothetical protein K2X59_04505 [Sphingomonas sp.]|nr:hypothetical protein [Sphingomonas sp.]
MKNPIKLAVFVAATVGLSGCAYVKKGIDRELRYPGGLAGSVYDKYYVFEANASKELQLLRAAFSVSTLASAATATVREDSEAQTVVRNLQEAVKEINYQAGMLYEKDASNPPKLVPCTNGFTGPCYPSLFEEGVPDLERSVFNLAFSALPKAAAVRLFQEVAATNLIGSIRAALKLALASLDSAHRAAATHRSIVEIMAQIVVANDATKLKEVKTVQEALCILGYKEPAGIGCTVSDSNITAVKREKRNQSTEYRKALAAVTVLPKHFEPVFSIIRSECLKLRVSSKADITSACEGLKFEPLIRPGVIPK